MKKLLQLTNIELGALLPFTPVCGQLGWFELSQQYLEGIRRRLERIPDARR